jgi:hypothetical protein
VANQEERADSRAAAPPGPRACAGPAIANAKSISAKAHDGEHLCRDACRRMVLDVPARSERHPAATYRAGCAFGHLPYPGRASGDARLCCSTWLVSERGPIRRTEFLPRRPTFPAVALENSRRVAPIYQRAPYGIEASAATSPGTRCTQTSFVRSPITRSSSGANRPICAGQLSEGVRSLFLENQTDTDSRSDSRSVHYPSRRKEVRNREPTRFLTTVQPSCLSTYFPGGQEHAPFLAASLLP